MYAEGSTSTGDRVLSITEVLKSGMLMSNATINRNNPGEWDTTVHFRVDESTVEGRALRCLLESAGVWFDS